MRLLSATAVLSDRRCGPALAKECRMPDLPPGVRVKLPPGCKDARPDRSARG